MSNVAAAAIILAAGEGKRMCSSKPKVLQEVLGIPMIEWIINTVKRFGILEQNICVITGYKKEILEEYLSQKFPLVCTVFQRERLGTGHAVIMAKEFLKQQKNPDILILNGDAPFIDVKTLQKSLEFHKQHKNSATIISAVIDNPTGYGRIIRSKETNSLCKIVEEKDATLAEKNIKEINVGAYWFEIEDLNSALNELKNNNATKEYYLTDAIGIFANRSRNIDAVLCDNHYFALGANDKNQLQQLNLIAAEYFS